MTELPKSKETQFRNVRLYLSDIKELWKLFEQNCESVTIETDRYRIDSLDDLTIIEGKIERFWLSGRNPDVHIYVYPQLSILDIRDDSDVKSLGLFEKAKETLRRSQSPIRFLSYFWIIWALMPINLLLRLTINRFVSNATFLGYYNDFYFYISSLIIILFLASSIIFFLKPKFIFTYEKDRSWFKRNKDEILVGIIIVIIGATISPLITSLFSKLFELF